METSASHQRLISAITPLEPYGHEPEIWLDKARKIVEGTPLLELRENTLQTVLQLRETYGAAVYAKVLSETPGETHYDYCMPGLITLQQLRTSAKDGRRIPPNTVRLLEPTSTNAGISLAWVARQKGFKSEIVMPEHMGLVREQRVREEADAVTLAPWLTGTAYLPGVNAMLNRRRQELSDGGVKFRIPNHSEVTDTPDLFGRIGNEVHDALQTAGIRLDVFIGALGNGTTIHGIERALREKHNPQLETIGFGEKSDTSPTMIGASGIGDLQLRFREELLKRGLPVQYLQGAEIRELYEGWNMGKSRRETIGISSAGALLVAKRLIETRQAALNILVLFYDKADRYGNVLVTEDDARYLGQGRWSSGVDLRT